MLMLLTAYVPVLTMKKNVTISKTPQSGSINFPTKTKVIVSTTTSQKWISKKQWVRAVQTQKCGGLKYPKQ